MTQQELAQELGISEGMVSQLKARGMPVDDLQAARQWRADRLTARAPSMAIKRERDTAQLDDGVTSSDYAHFRAQREQAEARIAQLRLAELSGELVRAEDIRFALGRALTTLKENLMALPHRLAPVLAAESDPNRVFEELREGIWQCMAVVLEKVEESSNA